MKKPTKRLLKKKIDKVFSEIVRRRGYCVRCGRSSTLQCAHIFSRRNLSIRWDLDNAICLCYACHIHWAHKEPILFTEFVKTYLGEFRYTQLRRRVNTIKKWSSEELEELLEHSGEERWR